MTILFHSLIHSCCPLLFALYAISIPIHNLLFVWVCIHVVFPFSSEFWVCIFLVLFVSTSPLGWLQFLCLW
jgi:hypothetical protein